MADAFSNSVTHANNALNEWGKVVAFLQTAKGQKGEAFNLDAERLGEFDKKIKDTLTHITWLTKIDANITALIPSNFTTSLENKLKDFSAALQGAEKEAAQATSEVIATIDTENFVVTTKTNATMNFADHMQRIDGHLDSVIKAYNELPIMVHAKELSTFLQNVAETKKEADNIRQSAAYVARAKKEVETINAHANSALGKATNAGLAGVFSQTHEDLKKKLFNAQIFFYVSLAIILGLATLIAWPVLYDLFSSANVGLDNVTSSGNVTSIGITISKEGIRFSGKFVLFLLILPAAWLARFSAARHRQLFLLKEDYQYKFSLAMAVEGFKKQSPTHEDEIAYATFVHLLFNPADRLVEKRKKADDDNPNFVLNWLMDKMGLNDKGKPDEAAKKGD